MFFLLVSGLWEQIAKQEKKEQDPVLFFSLGNTGFPNTGGEESSRLGCLPALSLGWFQKRLSPQPGSLQLQRCFEKCTDSPVEAP